MWLLGIDKRVKAGRKHKDFVIEVPFREMKAQLDSVRLLEVVLANRMSFLVYLWNQGVDIQEPSLLASLLTDYEARGQQDLDHELNIKCVTAQLFSGNTPLCLASHFRVSLLIYFFLNSRSGIGKDGSLSGVIGS